jgi:hypothetical protein
MYELERAVCRECHRERLLSHLDKSPNPNPQTGEYEFHCTWGHDSHTCTDIYFKNNPEIAKIYEPRVL